MIELLIMTVVGALIGWFTNYLAVKMLFRPIRPRRVPLIKIELQGLIPRRREEIAVTIGATVEKELISVKDWSAGLLKAKKTGLI